MFPMQGRSVLLQGMPDEALAGPQGRVQTCLQVSQGNRETTIRMGYLSTKAATNTTNTTVPVFVGPGPTKYRPPNDVGEYHRSIVVP
jgi:hypothetical protein